MKRPEMGVPGYQKLAEVLQLAYDQAAKGKGKERHANAKPFLNQPIMEISRMVGIGGQTFQICKKAQEATSMVNRQNYHAAQAELLGVIVYAAAAFLLAGEMQEQERMALGKVGRSIPPADADEGDADGNDDL